MELDSYREVQNIAKRVHDHLGLFINSASTEHFIAAKAEELLSEFGATETWYHHVPALVLLGSRSCLSISGKAYTPGTEEVGETNVITVDLSPLVGDIWGDCARSYFVEGGQCVACPSCTFYADGLATELELHELMKSFVCPETLFSELYEYGNKQIELLGYENLDFLGNLGHSIEKKTAHRKFIDKTCHAQLNEVAYFTFEPHIRKVSDKWGYKHENIYYFDKSGTVCEL